MSALRARCPHCRTLTAVAFDDSYECHSCGAAFAAGLVRVPRAWGAGGEPMVEAASTALPYPEALVVDRETLDEQNAALADGLPKRPLVLGGCCCSHVGAIRGLATRHGRLGVVWFDAHGDLNTPETSPSGNAWGMPLRMAIDEGSVRPADVALDVDVFEPGAVSSFMPAPGGMTVAEVDEALRTIASRTRVAGLGLTGLATDTDPATLADLAAAAGL